MPRKPLESYGLPCYTCELRCCQGAGFIFACGALLRVQGGGVWLSSGSWNDENEQYADRNNRVAKDQTNVLLI